ncbi:helix-turn-helix transcriptional regulator [Nocardioides sp. zg-1228]|uniref:helix-turn-helix transcriptional regulator n=1 Tax=Nocardioides sp. zg-1228 TaxID=2763008 RepID=UPI0016430CEC|nr:helix-turn-helix transcriptional regulator [Nocardioides sp. zg-1228]MBC2931400.1 helix-turn-helix transcriptional regulator [Nocardioides sp. zg-1228]QSF57017.1 helix-turn-helix transcriptional regulator [Nocardioides sp. zg-1228]
MSVAGPVWVLSPHLLVAQAITAALGSVGVPARTRRWESVDGEATSDDSEELGPAVFVAVVDGLDNPEVVAHVEALARRRAGRVVVVTSAEASVRWGGLLADDTVDVVTVSTSVTQLADVVRRLVAGDSAMDPDRRAVLRAAYAHDLDRRRQARAQLETLSPQQRRVLELLASGRRVAEVGVEMGVAEGTVRSHVKALRAKLGVSTQLKAVATFHQAYQSYPGSNAGSEREPESGSDSDSGSDSGEVPRAEPAAEPRAAGEVRVTVEAVPDPRRGTADRAPPALVLLRR